ncbi:sigma-70 family RNA polymerase sigma factor [Segetibacter koreensis]|uniref:sigma-70 family RNA polymerase sigma factor n=1 Tax=Segetibacter koreensis TaxID=398037 RepID=UPI00037840C7|nr:sigma-70 family RNA polymerase sigma factor [Segetibacter koreensis]
MEIEMLYTDMRSVLLNYIKTKVSNNEDAEDILQDTFIKVALNLNSVKRREKLQSWIYTITRNKITDYYRKRAGLANVTLQEEFAESTPEQEYNDVTKDLDCCLMNYLNQLPEEYRDILIDVELNGIKQKDLIDKHGLAYPSIRSRVQRGRDKLKAALLTCCNISWDNRGNILEAKEKNSCEPPSSKDCKK